LPLGREAKTLIALPLCVLICVDVLNNGRKKPQWLADISFKTEKYSINGTLVFKKKHTSALATQMAKRT
jgi:hypothetical protein